MAKGKRKSARTCSAYHIDSVNLEIDYEKLAEAIVKANNIAETQKKRNEPQQKRSFWKGIWEIWINKRDTDGQLMAGHYFFYYQLIF